MFLVNGCPCFNKMLFLQLKLIANDIVFTLLSFNIDKIVKFIKICFLKKQHCVNGQCPVLQSDGQLLII